MNSRFDVLSFQGLVSYGWAQNFQKDLVEKRIRDEIPDTLLFLEHRPVMTKGSGLQKGSPVALQAQGIPVLPPEIEFFQTDRGGDLTYHGPGQLVLYPIVKLDGSGLGPSQDVGRFLRLLERSIVSLLKSLGLEAFQLAGATGVWIGRNKVASVGVAVRKWVTSHGAALNVSNDLKPFHLIRPCGYSPEVMSRLADYFPDFDKADAVTWRRFLEKAWVNRWIQERKFDDPDLQLSARYLTVDAPLDLDSLGTLNSISPIARPEGEEPHFGISSHL